MPALDYGGMAGKLMDVTRSPGAAPQQPQNRWLTGTPGQGGYGAVQPKRLGAPDLSGTFAGTDDRRQPFSGGVALGQPIDQPISTFDGGGVKGPGGDPQYGVSMGGSNPAGPPTLTGLPASTTSPVGPSTAPGVPVLPQEGGSMATMFKDVMSALTGQNPAPLPGADIAGTGVSAVGTPVLQPPTNNFDSQLSRFAAPASRFG